VPLLYREIGANSAHFCAVGVDSLWIVEGLVVDAVHPQPVFRTIPCLTGKQQGISGDLAQGFPLKITKLLVDKRV